MSKEIDKRNLKNDPLTSMEEDLWEITKRSFIAGYKVGCSKNVVDLTALKLHKDLRGKDDLQNRFLKKWHP